VKHSIPETVRKELAGISDQIEKLEAARFNFLYGVGKAVGAAGDPKNWDVNLNDWTIDDAPEPEEPPLPIPDEVSEEDSLVDA
jgi:hypothetical protein